MSAVNCGTESLTPMEADFVRYYVGEARLNATEAARLAGCSDPNAYAWEIRRRPRVAEEIDRRLKERHLSSEEVLDELAQIARQDLSAFVVVDRRGTVKIDFKKAAAAGALKNVAGYEYNKQGRLILKFHDKMGALQALGRHHKLFTDRVETSNPEGIQALRAFLGVGDGENDGDEKGT